MWYEKVENVLLSLGYSKSKYEPCIYLKCKNNVKTFIALYVDDFFIFSNCHDETNFLKNKLKF